MTVLMGMAPGQNTDPKRPLCPTIKNSSGHRLLELSGLSEREYLEHYDRFNCLSHYPGRDRNQKGDRFPMKQARAAAAVHRQHLMGRRVIFVGRQVAHAFDFPKPRLDFFSWARCRKWDMHVSVIPHPSGCNLFWNDADNRAMAEAFFHNEINSR